MANICKPMIKDREIQQVEIANTLEPKGTEAGGMFAFYILVVNKLLGQK